MQDMEERSGALGTGRYNKTEKDIALDVTLKLGKYLKNSFPEIKLFTQEQKIFSHTKRTELANNSNADLFISFIAIHLQKKC